MDLTLNAPVLGPCKYDCRVSTYTFEQYPALNGAKDVDKDPSAFFACGNRTSRLRLVQDWLFFGLLQEWMADQFWEYYEHVQRNGYVCIEELQEKLVHTSSQQPLTQRLRAQKREKVLRFAVSAFANINQRNEETTSDPFPQVLLSVEVALETLFAMAGEPLWRALAWRRAYENSNATGRWPSINLETAPSGIPLSNSMIAKGWCYHELNHLFCRFRMTTVLLFASLRRECKDHSACIDASRCTVSDFIAAETAECKHTEDYRCHYSPDAGWKCSTIAADFEQMAHILEKGGIPVLRVRDINEEVKVDYVDASTVASYTAVSHLWADGLGNGRDYAIPLCQLRRLLSGMDSIKRADSKSLGFRQTYWRNYLNFEDYRKTRMEFLLIFRAPVSFYSALFVMGCSLLRRLGQAWKPKENATFIWLDVYSIPNVPKNRAVEIRKRMQKLKNLGIARMTPTYALAEYVLILEKEVHATSENTEMTELVARQVISPWRTRYWTSQEAILASRAFFITRDNRAVEAFDKSLTVTKRLVLIQNKINQGAFESLSIADMLLLDMHNTINVDAFLGRDVVHYESTLRVNQALSAWQYLVGKTSSDPGDLQCIIANLMDFDASEIYRLKPASARMKGIWKNFRMFPLNLVFSPFQRVCYDPESKRCISPADEDRWMPQLPGKSSLLWARKQLLDHPVGILADDGLRICLSALHGNKGFGISVVEVDSADLSRSCSRFILDHAGKQFWVQLHYDMFECHEPAHRQPGKPFVGGACNKDDCQRFHYNGFEVGPTTNTFQKICLILAYGEKIEDGGGGARIGVLSHDDTQAEPVLTSIFDCTITFGLLSHICFDRTFVDAPTVSGQAVLGNPQIFFRCDVKSWPDLKYRRDPANTAVLKMGLAEPVFLVFAWVPGYLRFSNASTLVYIVAWIYCVGVYYRVQNHLWLQSFSDDFNHLDSWRLRLHKVVIAKNQDRDLRALLTLSKVFDPVFPRLPISPTALAYAGHLASSLFRKLTYGLGIPTLYLLSQLLGLVAWGVERLSFERRIQLR